jgi:hypothetical protein
MGQTGEFAASSVMGRQAAMVIPVHWHTFALS